MDDQNAEVDSSEQSERTKSDLQALQNHNFLIALGGVRGSSPFQMPVSWKFLKLLRPVH